MNVIIHVDVACVCHVRFVAVVRIETVLIEAIVCVPPFICLPSDKTISLAFHRAFKKTRFTANSLRFVRKFQNNNKKRVRNAWRTQTINGILSTRSFVMTVVRSWSIWYCARISAFFPLLFSASTNATVPFLRCFISLWCNSSVCLFALVSRFYFFFQRISCWTYQQKPLH